ncbi:MAG: FoF1 ATP synthase subunit delta [Candidatus Babeliales bacterium]
MNGELILSRRYATAYVNVYGAQLDLGISDRLEKAAEFLQNTPAAQLVLKLSTLQSSVLKKALEQLCTKFTIPLSLLDLVALLIEHNRLSLLVGILYQIADIYKARKGIQTFQFISPLPLDAHTRERIALFLKNSSFNTIVYTEKIDPSLIAGIRLQSDTLLWEYSIKKQLNQLQHNFTL